MSIETENSTVSIGGYGRMISGHEFEASAQITACKYCGWEPRDHVSEMPPNAREFIWPRAEFEAAMLLSPRDYFRAERRLVIE